MRTKCYSVRLESMALISPKCYKATDFNGNADLIPSSQVFGQDYSVIKSEAYWISAWILEKKSITYSTKKEAWFDESGKQLPNIEVFHHVPERKTALKTSANDSLIR